uniref:Guanylate cyclase domain-containing protein n=1 Tax=Triparma pacifica TaxID=91992 RepID=A0A7S2QWL4_9STRA|mmetsp:Transcript_333/g.494  ORF Transcript_333/g.494 Transcript_333/m.494 type:complete len:1571 (+) Transcript_333:78-4790(+)
MSSGSVLPEYEPGNLDGPGAQASIPDSNKTADLLIAQAGPPVPADSKGLPPRGDLSGPSWFSSLPEEQRKNLQSSVDRLGKDPDQSAVEELCEKHKIDSRQLNELRAFLKGAFVPLSSESTLSTPQTKSQRPLKSRQFSHTSSVGAGSIVDSYESHGQFEIVKAQEKLARLQETTLDPYTLDFVHDDKVVLEMEDNYYREDASRFKYCLELFFTYGLSFFLISLSVMDGWSLIEIKNERESQTYSKNFDRDTWDAQEERVERFESCAMQSSAVRTVIFLFLIKFSSGFFKSDNYYTKPNHLLGAFGLLAGYLLGNSFIWNTKSYGQHVAYLIIVFYLTPLRTFHVLKLTTVHCSIYIVILMVLQFKTGKDDPLCMNNGYQYVCRPNKDKGGGKDLMTNFQEIMQPIFVVAFTIVLGVHLSHRQEKVLKMNFKTLKTNECQTEIMRLTTEQNQLMLQSMLPQEMIEKFKLKDSALVVDTYAEVTVLFCIIDNFVEIARTLDAENLLYLLNVVYSEFDRITEETGVYKIETVGEVFMGCAGCPQRVIDHADKAARCAYDMQKAVPDIRATLREKLVDDAGRGRVIQNLSIKIGLNSGKIVAGVLNTPATIRFKLFGDTVNTASRMQSLSLPGRVQISEKTYRKLIAGAEHRYYVFSEKRQVEAKGKGTLDTWFLEKVLSEKELRKSGRRLKKKEHKKGSHMVKVGEEGGEEEDTRNEDELGDSISGIIRAKLAVSLGGAFDVSSKNLLNMGSDRSRSSGSNGAISFVNKQGAPLGLALPNPNPNAQRPSLDSPHKSSGNLGNLTDSSDSTFGGMSRQTTNNPSLARRGTFMSKAQSGGFSLNTGVSAPPSMRGAPLVPSAAVDSTQAIFKNIYRKNYRNKENIARAKGYDIEVRRERLFSNFQKLVDRSQPQLTPGQFMLSLLGSDVKDVGKDEESARAESKYYVYKRDSYLKTIRYLMIFWAFFFMSMGAMQHMKGGGELSGSQKAIERDWVTKVGEGGLIDIQRKGSLNHVYLCFGVGLPASLCLAVLTYMRELFWKRQEVIMIFFLLLLGACVIYESGVYVSQVGFGTVTMFIMTLFQYELLSFPARSGLAIAISIGYYLSTMIMSVDLGPEIFVFGKESNQSNHSRFPLITNNAQEEFGDTLFQMKDENDARFFPPYGDLTFADFSIDSACEGVLRKSAWNFFKNESSLGHMDMDDLSLKNITHDFMLKGVLRALQTPASYWQGFLNASLANYYLGYLLGFSLLLMPATLQNDYYERVSYNKELRLLENTKKMNKQQDFEDMLLKRLLPPEIVPILPKKRAAKEVVAERFEEVTILFCDMVGFTKFSSELDPSELMVFLSALYAKYSAVLTENSLYTVEVIGDALLAVAGCPKRIETEDHASRALKAAFELIEVTRELSEQIMIPVNIRVGIHSGSVIAGVVGVKDPRYHLFGEAVKVAETMESTGEQDRVQCSHRTYENLFKKTDEVSVKFRSSLVFQRRVDMSEKARKKLEVLDHGECTYFVKQLNTSSSLTMRRLTLGRGQISPPPNKGDSIGQDKDGRQRPSLSREYLRKKSESESGGSRRKRR